jgi:hypothetical protein
MAKWTIRIDRKLLDLEITRALGKSPLVKDAAAKLFNGIFNSAKRTMLKEFDRHPVTLELLAGPRAVNMSGTLDGYGNLFSFIGFDNSVNPIEDLRQLLDIATTARQTIYKDRKWFFRVDTPNREVIRRFTPMPWESGTSWSEGIERGISGLSHYMFKKWAGSRSGTGFQLPYENLEEANFSPTPYMTEILANFRERVNDV